MTMRDGIRKMIFEMADKLHAEGVSKIRDAVLKECEKLGIKANTASTRYCEWRQARGMVKGKS